MSGRPSRQSFALVAALAVTVLASAACGDDSVDPTNPDAGPTKDATADGHDGHDGGDSGGSDGSASEAATHEAAVEASAEEAAAEASADAPVE